MRGWSVLFHFWGLVLLLLQPSFSFSKPFDDVVVNWKKGGEVLSEYDRIGFVRVMKTGSTTLIQEGFPAMHLKPHHCECPSGFIDKAANMFKIATPENDCECNATVVHSAAPHTPLTKVVDSYQQWKRKATQFYKDSPEELQKIKQGKLYLIGLLRNPIDRVISEFFYVHKLCKQNGWKFLYNDETYEHICNLDFESFIRAPGNPSLTRQIYFYSPDNLRGSWHDAVSNGLEEAKANLKKLSVIFLTKQLPESINLFSRYFHLNPGDRDPASHLHNKNVHQGSLFSLSVYTNLTLRAFMEEKMSEELEWYHLAVEGWEKFRVFVEAEVNPPLEEGDESPNSLVPLQNKNSVNK